MLLPGDTMVGKPSTTAKSGERSLLTLPTLVCGFLLSLLLSCSQYEFKLNDNTLYDPLALRKELALKDPQLQACVIRVITEQQTTAAAKLHQLLCGPGEIQSLDGIEIFTRLRQLGLAGNQLTTIDNLVTLTELRQLNLADNRISNAAVLRALAHLTFIDLSGNTALECHSVSALRDKPGLEMILPEHCDS